MPEYLRTWIVRGRTKAGSTTTRRIDALSADEARRKAEADGVHVREIVEDDEPATDRQRAYAAKLGQPLPPGISKREASYILDRLVECDDPATDEDVALADSFGLPLPSPHVGRRALMRYIKNALHAAGRSEGLASWYAFMVYRHLARALPFPLITSMQHPAVQDIGIRLAAQDDVYESILRQDAADWEHFGAWEDERGRHRRGASTRTTAYREAVMLWRLLHPDLVPDPDAPPRSDGRSEHRTAIPRRREPVRVDWERHGPHAPVSWRWMAVVAALLLALGAAYLVLVLARL